MQTTNLSKDTTFNKTHMKQYKIQKKDATFVTDLRSSVLKCFIGTNTMQSQSKSWNTTNLWEVFIDNFQ